MTGDGATLNLEQIVEQKKSIKVVYIRVNEENLEFA